MLTYGLGCGRGFRDDSAAPCGHLDKLERLGQLHRGQVWGGKSPNIGSLNLVYLATKRGPRLGWSALLEVNSGSAAYLLTCNSLGPALV